MRETRSSGSVEGVISDGHPYSDSDETDDAMSLPDEQSRGHSTLNVPGDCPG